MAFFARLSIRNNTYTYETANFAANVEVKYFNNGKVNQEETLALTPNVGETETDFWARAQTAIEAAITTLSGETIAYPITFAASGANTVVTFPSTLTFTTVGYRECVLGLSPQLGALKETQYNYFLEEWHPCCGNTPNYRKQVQEGGLGMYP